MDEDNDDTPEMPGGIQQQDSQILGQDGSPLDNTAKDELKAILITLEALPFKDEVQKTSFLEKVGRLEDYHVIQVFNLGVVPLQNYITDSPGFVEEVTKLFEICFSFCYTADVTKIVAFDFYAKALKFCFPPQPKQCLSTEVLSMLLELVLIFQNGRFATIFTEPQQAANSQIKVRGTRNFFSELLAIFENRRDGGCIKEIVDETLKFASADAEISYIEEHVVHNVPLRSDNIVSPVFLTNWMMLLKLEHVSNGFASALAKVGAFECTKQCLPIFPPGLLGAIPQTIDVRYESTISDVLSILEKIKASGTEINLPSDEERLNIFFKRLKQLNHRSMMETSLKLLATTTISNKVLKEVLDQFCCKENQLAQPVVYSMAADVCKAMAFDLVFKLLLLFPGGELVNKVLKFWKQNFSGDADLHNLTCLMALFVEGSRNEERCVLEERAERTLSFLNWLPSSLLPLITFWYCFLSSFIKIFPCTFQSHPEVLVFVHKALLAARIPAGKKREAYIHFEQMPMLEFLEWISQQNLTEEIRNEMIGLFMSCADGECAVHSWEFSINVIKQLSLCKQLPFSSKKGLLREVNYLAKQFKEQEKRVFQEFVEGVASNESLDLKDEILSEILGFLKRFVDKDRPMRTIPSNVLQLFSLVSATPISGDRRVKILQKSKESSKGLLSSIRILERTKSCCLKGGENEYFDLLYTAFVDILKEEKDLCAQFYGLQFLFPPPFQLQKVWVMEVARLVSLGLFSNEIDGFCCLPVLRKVSGIISDSEMLQLFREVRASTEKLLNGITGRNVSLSSPDTHDSVPEAFVSYLVHVVRSVVFSTEEKILLIQKFCESFIGSPDVLSDQDMEYAFSNLIPQLSPSDKDSCASNLDEMRLKLDQIMAIVENPTMMTVLSRIPTDSHRSLCSVLSTMNFNSFSKGSLMDIYHFIGSQKELDKRFFGHFLSVLQVAIQTSTSVQAVLEILQELICIIRAIPSELIPLTMLNFEHLLQNQVDKHGRERFVEDVIMKWDVLPNPSVLSYLEIPQLLWKVYTTADCPAKISELTDRTQEILKKVNERVESYCALGDALLLGTPSRNERRISCCELEWLVFHSSLSAEEAALACNLIFREVQISERLRCFTLSVVQIEDVCFTVTPEETTTTQVADNDNVSAPIAAVESVRNESSVTESQNTSLTPVSIAQKMLQNLKRIIVQEEDLTGIAFLLWDLLFGAASLGCAECGTCSSFVDDDVEVFLSILAAASSTEVILFWAKLNRHHVSQCSEVILKACKKTSEADGMAKKDFLSFHTVVYNTMETMRGRTPATSLFLGRVIQQPAWCFRLVKPQLRHLSNMLGSILPVDVILAVLDLLQVNVQAGATVAEIVSSWSSQQAVELVKSVKLCCQEEEMSSLNTAQSKFVWQLAEAYGRMYKNSYQDLLVRLKELIVLYDPEDAYGLNRLPKWRERMIACGFSLRPIDCWCVAFLMTPLENLTSRDVDAIVDLTDSRSWQLVTPVSEEIKTCIFPEEGFKVTQEGIKESQTKERLRLARLLCEFINVLKQRKPEENKKDAAIREIVVDACDELCRTHLKENRRRNDLYKIHGQKLKALFTEVFGKQRKNETECSDMVKRQAGEEQIRAPSSVARQSSYLHENLPRVLKHSDVYEPLLVLLRRWLSGIAIKPVLASHTREVVQRLFSIHSSEVNPVQLKELHGTIQAHVLSLENNQALIANLQAAGYNHGRQGGLNLWSSPSVECAGYLSKTESADSRRFEKKLTEVLRRLWNEWKDILFFLGVASIKVGEGIVCTKDLFGFQDSLKEMEEQVSAVKEMLSQMKLENPNLDRRVEELMRQEQRHRVRIKKLYKSKKVRNG